MEPRRRVFLTVHALRRCDEMGVLRSEVVAAIREAEVRYPSAGAHGVGRSIAVAGRLAVVHDQDLVVITVLWRGRSSRDLVA